MVCCAPVIGREPDTAASVLIAITENDATSPATSPVFAVEAAARVAAMVRVTDSPSSTSMSSPTTAS